MSNARFLEVFQFSRQINKNEWRHKYCHATHSVNFFCWLWKINLNNIGVAVAYYKFSILSSTKKGKEQTLYQETWSPSQNSNLIALALEYEALGTDIQTSRHWCHEAHGED
jgi:hypothetical protein